MPKRPDSHARFQIGDYYLDRPHPERGGSWYACKYDASARTVRRRSLDERDFEQAKIRLAALVAASPQAENKGGTPEAGEVMTVAVLKEYMDGHGAAIASTQVVDRAIALFAEFLQDNKCEAAPVSYWSPARQLEFAEWCHERYAHSAGYIARLFNVMRSAFIDAAKVKLREDALGNKIEAALIKSAPKIEMTREAIAGALKIPARKPRRATLSIEEMAAVLDSLKTEHLFRFAIVELCTWARPEQQQH